MKRKALFIREYTLANILIFSLIYSLQEYLKLILGFFSVLRVLT